MKSLFLIEKEFNDIAQQLIDNGGELTPELETSLTFNRNEFENKAQNYGMVIRSIDAEVNAIETEIKRLTELKKAREKSQDKLKERIAEAMINFGIEKIDSTFIKLSFRKSESVEVSDAVDKEYLIEKITHSPDKIKIKDAIKSGVDVVGAKLIIKHNLQIK